MPIDLENQFAVSLQLEDEEEEEEYTFVKKTKKAEYNCMPCGMHGKCLTECWNKHQALEENDLGLVGPE